MTRRAEAAGRRAVVLFTRDLRVHDQPALAEALRTSAEIVPLFVLDDGILGQLEAPSRVALLVESLHALRGSLQERGGDLVVREGDVVQETMEATTAVGAERVFVGRGAGAYAGRREERLRRACAAAGIELSLADTTTVVPPGALAPAGRDHYRVFTPYWRRWREHVRRDAAPAAGRVRVPPGVEPGQLPAAPAVSPGRPAGGEAAARVELARWLSAGVSHYAERADRLAVDGTSRLSPYLHLGCLSAAEVAARAPGGEGGEEFVRQLCWRDFYEQLLAANPSLPRDDLYPGRREWRSDDDAFAAWSEGRTGYPIVDAGMRQLRETAWLPNRARLIVAAFLTKTLGLDWRLGAAVFSRLLVDGDVASNVGNWQWVAGTGTDARPYRAFNPIAQARRFDPEGDYVRRWVPELAGIRGPAVHEPRRAAADAPNGV